MSDSLLIDEFVVSAKSNHASGRLRATVASNESSERGAFVDPGFNSLMCLRQDPDVTPFRLRLRNDI
jgi:hypothetical protein